MVRAKIALRSAETGRRAYASVSIPFRTGTVALRFFNVYGPRQDPTSAYSGVLSLFMKHLLAAPRPLFSAMANNRATSLCGRRATLCMKASLPCVAARCTTPAMAAVSRSSSWGGSAENGRRENPTAVRLPARGDVRHSMADTTLAVKELGHAPRFTIEEGLSDPRMVPDADGKNPTVA